MIWCILLGLITGIIGADVFKSPILGIILFGFGLTAFAFAKNPLTKKTAVLAIAAALGLALTLTRLGMLYQVEDYGQIYNLTVKSGIVVQAADDYTAWQGIVLEPADLTGATVIVYSEDFEPGVYSLSGKLYPPVQYRNPGQAWHYKRKLYAGEIGVMNRPMTLFLSADQSWLEGLRVKYRNNLISNLGPGDSSQLALAITTGDRSILSRDLRGAVSASGVGHIMALSGIHVSILSGIILSILRGIGISRNTAGILSVSLLIGYIIFVGPAASLIRAVLMSVYAMAAFIAGREKHGLSALLWTCFVMLMYNPLWLFDYAFVYSFLATLTCLTAGNRLEKFLYFLPSAVSRAASITFMIQLAALPLNLYLFGGFPLWAPVANTIIIPLMPLMAITAFGAGITSGLAGVIISFPAGLLLSGVGLLIRLFDRFSGSLELGGVMLFIAAVAGLSLIMFLSGVSKKRVISGIMISAILISAYCIAELRVCSVWFLDVGQGDAVLIRCRGSWILIDTGEEHAAIRGVTPALKHLGVTKLDAIVVTHPHSDHTGGIIEITENFPVGRILVNSCFLESEWAGLDHGRIEVVRGEVSICSSIRVYSHGRNFSNLNDNSLLVTLDNNGTTILFTGDIQAQGEDAYIPYYRPVDVLKVAHHGSQTSTSVEFLNLVRPATAVLSCGLGNRYGMPHPGVMENLDQSGAEVFRTDQNGFVRLVLWPWNKYSIFFFAGRLL